MEADAARIPVTDEGLLRGDGVFEVMKLYAGRPFALEDHLARMERSAANLRLPLDLQAVRADIAATLEAAGAVDDKTLRVLVTRAGHRVLLVENLKRLPPTVALATITYAPVRLLDGVKSLSYGANMLATRLAVERGADEALLTTPHGRVLEAPTRSFFYALDGALCTPPLSDHILDSITRRRLMGLVEVDERATTVEDLARAEEAFLASTTQEVLPVHRVDAIELPAAPGALSRAAAAAMREHIAAELAAVAH